MTETEIESDAFLKLLTDALRAGPGSPEWHQAVLKLRPADGSKSEHELILTAREHLASGREYRSIGAGAGFTRKVMQQIEDASEGKGTPAPNTASLVAIIGGLLLLGAVIWIGALLLNGGKPRGEDVTSLYLPLTRSVKSFTSSIPADWRTAGSLKIEARDGLRPSPGSAGAGTPTDEFSGAAVYAIAPSPAGQTVAVEVSLLAKKVSEDLITQVFVSDNPTFSADRGTTPHELVWLAQGSQVRVVLPSGRVETSSQVFSPSDQPWVIRLTLTPSDVLVSSNGQTIWKGPHQLAGDKPRTYGVRFLSKSGADADIAILSVRVLGK